MIDKKLLKELADLAQLQYDENESEEMLCELQQLADIAHKVTKFSWDECPAEGFSGENVLREDIEVEGVQRERMIGGAKTVLDGYITVPRVVEG